MYIQNNYSLRSLNSFGISATAKHFSKFTSTEELEELLSHPVAGAKEMILGGGSNILLINNFDGLVLKNEISGIEVVGETEKEIFVKAGAGVTWHTLVQYAVKNNWGGLENLSLIPGNVGASPMQNIGAYGVEIKDVFESLNAYDLHQKKVVAFDKTDCAFGYRESVFKRKYKDQFVILDVTYRLQKFPVFNISYGTIASELEQMNVEINVQSISEAVIRIRTSKLPDPKKVGNAGSFFKNPVIPANTLLQLQRDLTGEVEIPFFTINESLVKIPAAWLIEQCGWKGFRKGDAGCYEKQPLVLVNYGNASGKDIFSLSEEIIKSVSGRFGIELEREVNMIY